MKTIREAAADHVLVAAHRGSAAGNIPCNTLAAYEIALRQGADIVELDGAKTADGELFVFHPGMEFPHLRLEKHLSDITAGEVEKLRFVNVDGTPTAHPISRLDEALDLLKGRCYVNIDKFWTAIPEITAAVRRLMDMPLDVYMMLPAHVYPDYFTKDSKNCDILTTNWNIIQRLLGDLSAYTFVQALQKIDTLLTSPPTKKKVEDPLLSFATPIRTVNQIKALKRDSKSKQ